MNIVIVDLCFEKNSLHFDEFVRPVLDIVKNENLNYKVIYYKDLSPEVLKKFDKIILCGTALKDNDYFNYLDKFKWIVNFNKPLLGICAGAQIIAKVFDAKIKKNTEIGIIKPTIIRKDEILKGLEIREAYVLHNNYFEVPKGFDLIAKTKMPQIIKKNQTYAVLFHPEVRNKELIKIFINNI